MSLMKIDPTSGTGSLSKSLSLYIGVEGSGCEGATRTGRKMAGCVGSHQVTVGTTDDSRESGTVSLGLSSFKCCPQEVNYDAYAVYHKMHFSGHQSSPKCVYTPKGKALHDLVFSTSGKTAPPISALSPVLGQKPVRYAEAFARLYDVFSGYPGATTFPATLRTKECACFKHNSGSSNSAGTLTAVKTMTPFRDDTTLYEKCMLGSASSLASRRPNFEQFPREIPRSTRNSGDCPATEKAFFVPPLLRFSKIITPQKNLRNFLKKNGLFIYKNELK